MNKAIGGYFDLDISGGAPFHEGARGFNSARSAFAWFLRERGIRRLFLPEFNCPVMFDVADELGVRVELYGIDDAFRPLGLGELPADAWLFYVNYFGLQDRFVAEELRHRCAGRLMLDNAQALFALPLPGIPAIYSPRKFIGVPDGGWLVDRECYGEPSEVGRSSHRFAALLGRVEDGPEAHYADFLAVEESIAQEGVKGMSKLTASLIARTDLPSTAECRRRNFAALHKALHGINAFDAGGDRLQGGPLAYPLLLADGALAESLRGRLRSRRIYVPTYWQDLPTARARSLSQRLLPLPVDQRYSADDMAAIVREVQQALAECRGDH